MNGSLATLLGTKTLALTSTGDRTFWLPAQASTFTSDTDALFYFIFWVCVFFFMLILAMAVIFVAKYRKRGERPEPLESSHHNTALELIWSGIPLILVLAIFVMGFRGYMDMATPPQDAYEIQVTAQKWNWNFTYPNGYVDSDLHVPVGTPVRLVMSSEDVLHSFYVPELRAKQDVVPGRYTQVWFEATKPIEATVFCTEYCGTSHSEMQSLFVAHEPAAFDAWLTKAADFLSTLSPEEGGALLYKKRGCVQCHSVDGSGGIGPTFQGLFGARRQFTSGETGTADENYIRASILNPRAEIVAGFDPVMPTFQGRIKDAEITAIIAYIKSLSR